MSGDQAAEQESIAFNNATATEANFETLCKGAIIRTTADVHIAFDEAANTSSFLLCATDEPMCFPLNFTRISAVGDSGSGTLYIIAKR